jgi:hypothetical protein
MTSVASTFLSRVRTTSGTTGRAVEEAIQGFKHVLKGSGLETEIQELEKEDKIPPVDAVLIFTSARPHYIIFHYIKGLKAFFINTIF